MQVRLETLPSATISIVADCLTFTAYYSYIDSLSHKRSFKVQTLEDKAIQAENYGGYMIDLSDKIFCDFHTSIINGAVLITYSLYNNHSIDIMMSNRGAFLTIQRGDITLSSHNGAYYQCMYHTSDGFTLVKKTDHHMVTYDLHNICLLPTLLPPARYTFTMNNIFSVNVCSQDVCENLSTGDDTPYFTHLHCSIEFIIEPESGKVFTYSEESL